MRGLGQPLAPGGFSSRCVRLRGRAAGPLRERLAVFRQREEPVAIRVEPAEHRLDRGRRVLHARRAAQEVPVLVEREPAVEVGVAQHEDPLGVEGGEPPGLGRRLARQEQRRAPEPREARSRPFSGVPLCVALPVVPFRAYICDVRSV